MNILVTGANGQLGREMQRLSAVSPNNYTFTDVAELGAGKVLANIIKRSDKEMNAFSVGSAAEIEELAKNL